MKLKLFTATLFLGLTAAASAATTTFTDLTSSTTSGNVTLTVNGTTATITASDTSLYTSTDNQAQSSVSFTLNLTAILDALNSGSISGDEDTELLTMNYGNANYTGLYLNSSGQLQTRWGSSVYDQGNTYTLFTYDDTTSSYTIASGLNTTTLDDGTVVLALTYTQDMATRSGGTGAKVYDSTGTALITDSTLASSSNTTLSSITLNAAYITSASVDSSLLSASDAGAAAAALVPEPATATLGLLALGALALRRRRA